MKPTFVLHENELGVDGHADESVENEYCEQLPNSVLRNIFKYLCYQDISKCHLTCKYIHKYLCDHAKDFERPHLNDLIIESIREPGWVRQLRVEFKCIELFGTHACLKKTEFTGSEDNSFESISKLTPSFLKMVVDKCCTVIASGDVTFRHIVLDDIALKQLLPVLEPTSGLFFDHCKIDLSFESLCSLFESSNCVKLGVNESEFVQAVLSDEVLASMKRCDVIALRWCKPKHLPGITYRTLLRWEAQKRLPKEIDFEGMSTDFTTFGLINLIEAFEREHHDWLSSPNETTEPPPVEWNLGEVLRTDDPVKGVRLIPGVALRHSTLVKHGREEYEVVPSWASHIADDSFVSIEFTTRNSNSCIVTNENDTETN